MNFETVSVVLDLAVTGLGLLLGAVALEAARRYREPRFALVGVALLVFAVIGGLGSRDWLLGLPGSGTSLDPGVAALLVFAEVLLLGSLVLPRRAVKANPRE